MSGRVPSRRHLNSGNVSSRSVTRPKALEDVQTALKAPVPFSSGLDSWRAFCPELLQATESLRLGGLRTHRGLRGAVSHRPLLTDRSGSETCRHGAGGSGSGDSSPSAHSLAQFCLAGRSRASGCKKLATPA